MLIEFNVENFRSIKEEVTLSMVSTKDASLEDNLIKIDVLKEDSLLKSAAIYGANASGKTNVLLALTLLKGLVTTSHNFQKGDSLEFTPFKLDKKCLTKPIKMSITFIKKGVKYVYGLSFNKEKIISEYLYSYPYKKTIFERKNTNDYKFMKNKKEQDVLSLRTRPNQLYLSKATLDNYEPLSKIFDWFKEDLRVIISTDYHTLKNYTAGMLKDDSTKKLILNALAVADVGIDDISRTIEKLTMADLPKDMPQELKKLVMNNEKEIKQSKINTIHKGVSFDFDEEESEGTKKIFSLIGPWIDALKNGRILIVDELDVKLHHLLNVFLIKLFHDPTQNKNNAQLIFTTHNTNLLDRDIFRRDQIWFTEKDDKIGVTDLYSLVEYSPRKDKDVERGYLAGKYGALPFIKENKIF
ncbi:MAG: ATP-binding protein [Candidatus Aenigmarchaeota archaeon]|nr:ATP-binding protein [Candidatus Aenigmarchaeota archaeon]